MNILCKIGIHRPLKNHTYDFTDKVSRMTVYEAECSCGIKWMVDSPFKYFGHKIKKESS